VQEQLQDQVKSFTEEKFKALAEKNGWTLGYAQGFVDGEVTRRNSEPAPRVALIGIDQYALGFRAAFFVRRNQEGARNGTRESNARLELRLQA